MSKILIVEDDRSLLELLGFALSGEGFEVVKVYDGNQAIDTWRREQPDLVVLDANIPERDGFEICEVGRRELSTPVIMLTARTSEEDMARGFAVGADDYVTKPFSPRLLLARIHAVLRRASTAGTPAVAPALEEIAVGDLTLDPQRQEVIRRGKRIKLTSTEFRLLHLLVTNRNAVVNSETILDRVWGPEGRTDTGSLKAHIRHLREKVELNPSLPELIVTVPGIGYLCRLADGTSERGAAASAS